MATNEKGYLVQLQSPEGENVYPIVPPEAIVKSDGTTYDFDSLFTSVSNGKALVASAITDKGVETAADATYQQMAENVSSIKTGVEFTNLVVEGLTQGSSRTLLTDIPVSDCMYVIVSGACYNATYKDLFEFINSDQCTSANSIHITNLWRSSNSIYVKSDYTWKSEGNSTYAAFELNNNSLQILLPSRGSVGSGYTYFIRIARLR